MDSINIHIQTVNHAFDGDGCEVARILRDLADKIEERDIPYYLYDINGNRVGIVEVEE